MVSAPGPADRERARVAEQIACLERLHRSTGEGVFAFDRAGRCLHWNGGMKRLTGLSTDDVIGPFAPPLLPLLERAGLGQAAAPALDGGEEAELHRARFHIAETGRRGVVDVSCTPLLLDGRVYGGVTLVREVREAREAGERALAGPQAADAESRFRTMADASPFLIWMSGPDARCNFFNQSWLEFTGRALADELGSGWSEGVHDEDLQGCMDGHRAAFAARRRFDLEYRLRRHDGSYRWIFDQGSPRYASDGTFAGYIGLCVDVTDRKQLEADLRQAIAARDDFLSIGAHELRTPLTPMRLVVQSLLSSSPEQPLSRVRAKLELLSRNVDRQARLIENLLTVSRITNGPIPLDLEETDLVQMVRATAAQFEEETRRTGQSLSLRGAPSVVALWDRDKVEHIVSNLISNGVKYGGGKPLEVTVEHGGDRARIVVRDQGIGISPRDRARIFERFERAVSDHGYRGFGLGLWITRRLAEAMGGAIQVESEPDRGSIFTVELPLRSAMT
jgi:PAS domain S-box-containing protein